jgi:cyclic pyranopterin phosphate synthase
MSAPPPARRAGVTGTPRGVSDTHMISVTDKPVTHRAATARALVRTTSELVGRVRDGQIEKGDVLATARVAGIMAAKATPQLVPLCHPLLLSHVAVEITLREDAGELAIQARAETTGQTGVEMEALCAAAAAALCIHDMLKRHDPALVIDDLCLVEKHGGASGDWYRPA